MATVTVLCHACGKSHSAQAFNDMAAMDRASAERKECMERHGNPPEPEYWWHSLFGLQRQRKVIAL